MIPEKEAKHRLDGLLELMARPRRELCFPEWPEVLQEKGVRQIKSMTLYVNDVSFEVFSPFGGPNIMMLSPVTGVTTPNDGTFKNNTLVINGDIPFDIYVSGIDNNQNIAVGYLWAKRRGLLGLQDKIKEIWYNIIEDVKECIK